MKSPTASTEDRGPADAVGRLCYGVLGGATLVWGESALPGYDGWIILSLGAACFFRVFTYRRAQTNKTVGRTMALFWAVLTLGVLLPLMLVMMFAQGMSREPVMWAILLAGIVPPGLVIRWYFRGLKS